jgi:hypothetical protein
MNKIWVVGLASIWLAHVQAWTSPMSGWLIGKSEENPFSSAVSSRRDCIASGVVISSLLVGIPRANAFSFGNDSQDRRQKELCIVNILRLQYWAQTVALSLESSQNIANRKRAYLDARLGAKAIVAKKQKVGGGATVRVFILVSLGIKGCLDDLKFYAKDKKKIDQLKEDLTEALASIVEFDGLETTQDPSPRSSLTLGQYDDEKALFVRRMLSERIVPLTQELVDYFGAETRAQCEAYVREYYVSELPPTVANASVEDNTARAEMDSPRPALL